MEREKSRKSHSKIFKLFSIIILSISILFCSTVLNKKAVFADSGYDFSYDSGSSSSSSDWGSSSYDGSSYDYDGDLDGGSIVGTIIFFIILFVILVIVNACKKSTTTTSNTVSTVNDQAVVNRIKEYIPNFDRAQFLSDGFNIYKDVQNAWMNFKLDDVKDKITDEMFNMYQSELDALEIKGEQNIMKDFTLKSNYLKDVVKQNDNITITTCYVIDFYDYIVEQSTGKVLRGSSTTKMRVTYEMKFRKTLDEKLTVDKCPCCGAEIKQLNGSGTCEYCGSKIVSENSKWVLTDKKITNQTRV